MDLYLKLSDVDSDDAVNLEKLKKTLSSRHKKVLSEDENDSIKMQVKKRKKLLG